MKSKVQPGYFDGFLEPDPSGWRRLRSANQFVNGPSPERAATTRMRRGRCGDFTTGQVTDLHGGFVVIVVPASAFAMPGNTRCATLGAPLCVCNTTLSGRQF